ncbi:MAG: molybdopterin oxidoreductase [Candidatus Binatia bacterium]|nr:MAG: molybdopterin oxidoreductase [Candidatus Binatia bacterium]
MRNRKQCAIQASFDAEQTDVSPPADGCCLSNTNDLRVLLWQQGAGFILPRAVRACHAEQWQGHCSGHFIVLQFATTSLSADAGLTAVEQFASEHARGGLPASGLYRHPIPLRAPQHGEQYAFEVDLDACTGCKACVTACHALNGLDAGETWRNVSLLVGEGESGPVLQHVTASCHHCAEPACLHGCPANAYEKDPLTGIVRHLDDNCIGCRYCTFTCPYGAPQYVGRLGIVRKCDLCADRLAVGESPACVQGCPNGAIAVRLVSVEAVKERASRGRFLPHVPPPHFTQPASVYRRSGWPERWRVADTELLRPEGAHWPLAVMLVLTQMSVGAFVVGELVQHVGVGVSLGEGNHAALSFGVAALALGASVLHLGRPLRAWRALLGLGHSWLSREVAAFGLFACFAATAAAIQAGLLRGLPDEVAIVARAGALVSGCFGIFASAMLYRRTARPAWRGARLRFALTAALLGSASTLLGVVLPGISLTEAAGTAARSLGCAIVALALAKLALEACLLISASRGLASASALGRTARLLLDVLYQWTALRFLLGWLGGVALPVLALAVFAADSYLPAYGLWAAGVLLLGGEILERILFFRSAVPAAASEGHL